MTLCIIILCIFSCLQRLYYNIILVCMSQQVTSDYRKKYCDVLNDIGYGFDAFGALDLSVDVINSIADIKEE